MIKINQGCLIYTPTLSIKIISKIIIIKNDDNEIKLELRFIDAWNRKNITAERDLKMMDDFEEYFFKNRSEFEDKEEFPLHKICKNCGEVFLPKSDKRDFCYMGNGKCRVAYHRANSK